MKGRIAIPLHDAEGRLIGYAGRLADEEAIDEENPRYMLPGSRERDGIVHDFCKSLFLFNGHRIEGPVERLIAVEGFFGAMWLHQHGYPNAVALMGSSCSERQAELLAQLLTPAGCLWVMPDGDEAGDRFAVDVLTRVSPRRAVRWVQLDHEKQPDGCGPSELEHLLGPGLQTAHSMNP
jgi:DNA primase